MPQKLPSHLPFEVGPVATRGLASSACSWFLIATAFLILFSFPPTLTELLLDNEGLLWLDDTVGKERMS